MTAVLGSHPDRVRPPETGRTAPPQGAGFLDLLSRFPARLVAADWPAAGQERQQVLRLVAAPAGLPESRVHVNHRRGLPVLLDWLQEQPGQTWQQRWLASGADAAGDHATLPPRSAGRSGSECEPGSGKPSLPRFRVVP